MALRRTNRQNIRQLDDDIFIIKSGAIVEYLPGIIPHDTTDTVRTNNVRFPLLTSGLPVAKWGVDNMKPTDILRLVRPNHIKPQLLQTERDFIMGSKLSLFSSEFKIDPTTNKTTREVIPAQDTEMEEWADQVELDHYFFAACTNWVNFRNIPNYASIDAKTNKIDILEVIDCVEMRKQQFVNGKVGSFYRHPDWRFPLQGDIQIIPAYDRTDPWGLPQFVSWTMDYVSGQPYYAHPAWWGTENWTKISNSIPAFHVAGLENGYNIKYHIKVPYAYLLKLTGGSEDPKLVMEQKDNVANSLDDFLSGIKNKDKAFITFSLMDSFGKEMPGWEIKPLDNPMTDKAYVELDNHANINQTSGHGIMPGLAGIDTGGKLGGSGSEMRILYDLHIALRTPQPRQKCLHFLNNVVMNVNGWKKKGIFWGVEDVNLTTLDINPTGKTGVVNQQM